MKLWWHFLLFLMFNRPNDSLKLKIIISCSSNFMLSPAAKPNSSNKHEEPLKNHIKHRVPSVADGVLKNQGASWRTTQHPLFSSECVVCVVCVFPASVPVWVHSSLLCVPPHGLRLLFLGFPALCVFAGSPQINCEPFKCTGQHGFPRLSRPQRISVRDEAITDTHPKPS